MAILIALQVAAFALLNLSFLSFWDIFDGSSVSQKIVPANFMGFAVSIMALCFGGFALMHLQ